MSLTIVHSVKPNTSSSYTSANIYLTKNAIAIPNTCERLGNKYKRNNTLHDKSKQLKSRFFQETIPSYIRYREVGA